MISDNIAPALVGAVVGGLITMIGWFVNYSFGKRKDIELKQREARLNYTREQIEELYSPLWGLAEQSRIVRDVAARRLPSRPDGRLDRSRFTDEDNDIYMFFNEKYFLPINAQISELLRKKVYLLKDGKFPESFKGYLEHQALSESLYQLWKEKRISSKQVEGKGYPPEFNHDIKVALDELREQYLNQLAIITDIKAKSTIQ
jgi:hypothetical protein